MGNYHITVLPAGWYSALPAQHTVLAGLEMAGVVLPSSCRNGTCRTCLCQLEAGTVRYLIDWPGVSADEKRQGWILPCVAVATSELQLRAPLARRSARSDAPDA
jgi:ferredoxin